MLDKQKLAYKTARLLGGGIGQKRAAAALCALLAVVAAGILLAWRAAGLRRELMNSQLVRLASVQPDGSLARLLTDPERSALFMKYIDSFADAAGNLEIPMRKQLIRFSTRSQAAQDTGVTLETFSYDWAQKTLSIGCTGEWQSAEAFAVHLTESGDFLSAKAYRSDDYKYYIVFCEFD